MQKPYPNWLSDTQLHQASLLISELDFVTVALLIQTN